jgi:hypothetical protein
MRFSLIFGEEIGGFFKIKNQCYDQIFANTSRGLRKNAIIFAKIFGEKHEIGPNCSLVLPQFIDRQFIDRQFIDRQFIDYEKKPSSSTDSSLTDSSSTGPVHRPLQFIEKWQM